MNLKKILQNIGLSDKEAKIYLALLELGEALPSTIARRTGVKRPTTYVVLEQLQKQGLVSYAKKGRTTYYQALNPHSLLEKQYKTYHALEESLPDLLALHHQYTVTPQMRIFEGKEGLIRIMEDTLISTTDLHVWADTGLATTGILKDYYPSYIKKKIANNLWVRGVVCDEEVGRNFAEKGKEELRELYFVPRDKFPFKNEIIIYEDKVAIIAHEDRVGVILQNKNIADTQRSIHLLTFEYAKQLTILS